MVSKYSEEYLRKAEELSEVKYTYSGPNILPLYFALLHIVCESIDSIYTHLLLAN